MIYWDTSALLKLYIAEQDSDYFLDLAVRTEEPIASSVIVTAEVLCAAYRKECCGDLKPGGADAILDRFQADAEAGRILMIPYGPDVAAAARKLVKLAFERPRPLPVRSLDAIHVASALAGRARALAATDRRLRQVASLWRIKLLP